MTRPKLIALRLREVLLDGKWIANTNYKEQILSVNWQQANAKIHDLNTIAALTFHINYYLRGLLQVFNGGDLTINDKFSFDMPEINSESSWNNLVNDFLNNAESFVTKIEQLEDAELDAPFVDKKYGTYLRNIEGVIEHSYYHLGQISLVKKIIFGKPV